MVPDNIRYRYPGYIGDTTSYWVASSLTVRLNGMPFYCIEQILSFGNVTSLLTVTRHFLNSSK